MEFKTYNEVDPEQVLDLNLACFGWLLDRRTVKRVRNYDPYCPEWFAYYLTDGDDIKAQVGATYPKIKTSEGVMTVGFIWGVGTLPIYARQGLSKKLMNRVHEQMEEDGVDLFILSTWSGLVAHSLYEKLGYVDITEFEWGIRKGHKWKKNEIRTVVRKHKINDWERLYKESSRNCYGFVLRYPNYLRARRSWDDRIISHSCTFMKDATAVGYALINVDQKRLNVMEMFCPDMKYYKDCLIALENEFPKPYVSRSMHGRADISKAFEDFGIQTQIGYGTLMTRWSKKKTGAKELKKLMGIDKGMFQATGLDCY